VVAVTVIYAAGGLPWRQRARGLEVPVIRRLRYNDWTLPKGKLEPGEPSLAAAVREVREETGIDGVPQVRLPSIQYLTGEPGVEKVVDFWSMRVHLDRGRESDDEVDEVRWVPVAEATAMLTYGHDRGVVAALAELPTVRNEVLLVRHAQAGTRKEWSGPDDLRPLDSYGRRKAKTLSEVLALFHPARVVSASPARCQETVSSLGLPVQVDPRLDERSPDGLAAAVAAVRELAASGVPTVVCSQGKVIPPLLAGLRPGNATAVEEFRTPKGGGWLLAFGGIIAVSADRLPVA
jgi:8-oxo-(d)GTP phosphatase